MSSNRPRRKCVSVSFAGDDDVVQHVVHVGERGKHAQDILVQLISS